MPIIFCIISTKVLLFCGVKNQNEWILVNEGWTIAIWCVNRPVCVLRKIVINVPENPRQFAKMSIGNSSRLKSTMARAVLCAESGNQTWPACKNSERILWQNAFWIFLAIRGHSITTWTRWGGGGGQKKSVFVHAQGIKTVRAFKKMAKSFPRSCWMPPYVLVNCRMFMQTNRQQR